MRKNKGAVRLPCNRAAYQRFYCRHIDRTILLHPLSENSSLRPSSVVVLPGLCRTWSETPKMFSCDAAQIKETGCILDQIFLFDSQNSCRYTFCTYIYIIPNVYYASTCLKISYIISSVILYALKARKQKSF